MFSVCRFLALARTILAMGTGEVRNLSWFLGEIGLTGERIPKFCLTCVVEFPNLRTTRGLIPVRSLRIYAGVRFSPTGHVRFQDQVSKNLIDLVPPPPAQYLSFTGAMQRLHDL